MHFPWEATSMHSLYRFSHKKFSNQSSSCKHLWQQYLSTLTIFKTKSCKYKSALLGMLIIRTNEGWKKPLQEETKHTKSRTVRNKYQERSKIAEGKEKAGPLTVHWWRRQGEHPGLPCPTLHPTSSNSRTTVSKSSASLPRDLYIFQKNRDKLLNNYSLSAFEFLINPRNPFKVKTYQLQRCFSPP